MPARDDPGALDVLERFDRASERYESWYETRRGALAAEAERRLLDSLLGPEATPNRALEVGCGTGYFTEWLDTRYGSVVGLDPAPAMLRELRRRHRTFPVVRGDAHRLPFADGVFGAVLFLTTLEFVDDPDGALREAVRVARSEVVLLWLNPWSVGAIKRRFAAGFLLSQAKRLSRRRVHAMLTRCAGARARGIEWGSALFPWPLGRTVARVPLGDVLAIKLALAAPITKDRIFHPAESGRQLCIEQSRDRLFGEPITESRLFSRGMCDHGLPRLDQQVPKRSRRRHTQRVDDRQSITGSNLNQTQLRLISIFGNELGIKCNDRRISQFIAELTKIVDRADRFVFQGSLDSLQN